MKIFILLIVCIMSVQAVITIAPVDIGSKPGFSGGIKGSFVTKRGNTDSDEYSAGLRVQFDNNSSYVAWSDLSFSYAKALGTTNTNKTFAHIRYIHTFYKKDLNWEGFIQSQTDKFTKIRIRLLAGIGLRYYADMNRYGSLYVGFGGFKERIDYTTYVDPSENNLRLNTYIAYKSMFSQSTRFSYIGYYQPNIDKVNDYIISNSAELKVEIYEKLSINFELVCNYDSQPAIGVKKYDFSQITSFIYDF